MADIKYLTVSLTDKDIERIFSKISINLITGCWEWTAAKTNYGYGVIWYQGRQEQAHRLLYAYFFGDIPMGVASDIPVVDHAVCDNPGCCCPFHLELKLTIENLRRTNSISAVNRRKTHCKYGHPLTDYPNRTGGYGRYCVTCSVWRSEEAYKRRKERLGIKDKVTFSSEEERQKYHKEKARKYREEHKEEMKVYLRDYQEKNRERLREYRRENHKKQKQITP